MDQLAQLKDIHLPEQVHQWPIAIGWWILLLVLIAIITVAIKHFLMQRRLTNVKRQAIKQLQAQDELTTEQCVSILKWASIHYFSRQDIAALHGSELANFLASKLDEQYRAEFIKGVEEAFNQYYRHFSIDIYAKDVQQATLLWFQKASLYGKGALPTTETQEANHD